MKMEKLEQCGKIMSLSKEEKTLIEDCIRSHQRMIKFHKKQILDLEYQMQSAQPEETIKKNKK